MMVPWSIINRWAVSVLCQLIGFYRRFLSPFLGSRCRFVPTCSAYGEGVLRAHGLGRGGALLLHRLVRCNPLGGYGYDPVPEAAKVAGGCSQQSLDKCMIKGSKK